MSSPLQLQGCQALVSHIPVELHPPRHEHSQLESHRHASVLQVHKLKQSRPPPSWICSSLTDVAHNLSSPCYHPWGSDPSVPHQPVHHQPGPPWKTRCFSAEMGRRYYRMQDFAVAEFPLAGAFRPVLPAAALTWHTIPRSFFLAPATGLPPAPAAASLLSLGFYNFHCTRETQSSTEPVS